MNYRSISDLSRCVRENLAGIPGNVDLIVGVPRSGSLVASMIALGLNLKVTDLDGFLNDHALPPGNTRQARYSHLVRPSDARHVLVVDDSVRSGSTIAEVKASVEALDRNQKISYGCAYISPQSLELVDLFLEVVPEPRSFEWNLMHRRFLRKCCVDIDGVLCLDPSPEQNDDGPRYRDFLVGAVPLVLPSAEVGHLVTSRLEKYREQTEFWLQQHGVQYQNLHMLDLPDAATRRRLNCHARFKAEVFKKLPGAELFIESEPRQSQEIAQLSGKPVVCFKTQEIYQPGLSGALVEQKSRGLLRRLSRRLRSGR